MLQQIRDEYAAVSRMAPPVPAAASAEAAAPGVAAVGGPGGRPAEGLVAPVAAKPAKAERESALSKLIDDLPSSRPTCVCGGQAARAPHAQLKINPSRVVFCITHPCQNRVTVCTPSTSLNGCILTACCSKLQRCCGEGREG